MSPPDFRSFESELLQCGIAPRIVRRSVDELQSHFDDLQEEGVQSGLSGECAAARASQHLGDLQSIAAGFRAQPELRSWAYHYPRLALLVYPLTCLAVLPAVPVIAGVAHASELARWGTCLLLGALVTASLFLIMQLSITLT